MNIIEGTKNRETLNISSERNKVYSSGWTAEGFSSVIPLTEKRIKNKEQMHINPSNIHNLFYVYEMPYKCNIRYPTSTQKPNLVAENINDFF